MLFMQDDKVSILDDAIDYLKKLKERIKELEVQKEQTDIEPRSRRLPQGTMEATSGSYFNKTNNGKKSVVKKRKVCDIEDLGREVNSDAIKGNSINDVSVSMSDNGVVVEMKCPSRAGRLLEVMEAVNRFGIDFTSVQSTEVDGNLHLTIKSKVSTLLCLLVLYSLFSSS